MCTYLTSYECVKSTVVYVDAHIHVKVNQLQLDQDYAINSRLNTNKIINCEKRVYKKLLCSYMHMFCIRRMQLIALMYSLVYIVYTVSYTHLTLPTTPYV